MATFPGTPQDDTLIAGAGDDTYQLGAGSDTIYFNASVDGSGVLTWDNGFDTVISADGGIEAPNYDRLVFNFSGDYIYPRKVGDDLELSVYAHKVTGDTDPGATDQVGKITLRNAFTASLADRISRIEGPDFVFDAIAAPVADLYGHTAIYKVRNFASGNVEYGDWYVDIDWHDTLGIEKFTDGTAYVSYFDSGAGQAWSELSFTYSNYGTASQALMFTRQVNDDGSVSLTGAGGKDTLVGTAGNDFLDGQGANDLLNGGTGNDTLLGGGGDDFMMGGQGDDSLVGGSGTDNADYFYSDTRGPVYANLATGLATGGGGNDTLSGIENLNGSDFNDVLVGDGQNNGLEGHGGNDSLSGGAGSDFFRGGAGNDTLDGGEILDRINYSDLNSTSYSDSTAGIVMNLQTGLVQDGLGGTDTLININWITGSNFADLITGSAFTNLFEQFEGLAGNDTIDGGGNTTSSGNRANYATSPAAVNVNLGTGQASDGFGGTDTLINITYIRGSGFGDVLTGSNTTAYTEWFEGRAGNDTIDGLGGVDTLRFDAATAGVIVNLATGTVSDGQGGTDTVLNIENARGVGFNDHLTGDAGNNDLDARGGDDTLIGGDGQDSLRGGTGSDLLDGGTQLVLVGNSNYENWRVSANQSSQYDLAYYTDATSGVTVMLGADGANGSATGGGVGNDVLSNIEMVLGSPYGDVIHGSDRNVNEILRGGAGDDTIQGGSGAGTDLGSNFVDYRSAAGSVSVNLSTNSASGADGNDVITGVRGIISGDFHDLLTGDAQDNYFDGGGGNDTIAGGDGADVLSFTTATGGVTASLATGASSGAAGNDTFTSIERLRGSEYADTLTGGSGNDSIQGRAGNDSIDGGAGNDELHAGYGVDTVDGGANTDALLLDSALSAYTVTLLDATRTRLVNAVTGEDISFVNVESVVFSDGTRTLEAVRSTAYLSLPGTPDPDTLNGGPGHDTLLGQGGDDYFDGGAGNDSIDGGADTGYGDVVAFSGATSGVVVDLNAGTASDGQGGTDTLLNIERVIGTPFDDNLAGNARDNIFDPGAGNDVVNGAGGRDTVSFGGVSSAVVVNLLTGVASGAAIGTDVLASIENVQASYFGDQVTLSHTAGSVFGRAGSDAITGGNGDDVFTGGSGADTLHGGAGLDAVLYTDDGADGGGIAATGLGVTVNLATGTATDNWGHTDTLISIELAYGSSYADRLTGGNPASGSGVTDGFEGFRGNAGNDTIDGGAGFDRAYYDNSPVAVSVTLGGTASGSAQDGWGGADTLINIEEVRGSAYNDSLAGSDSGVFESFEGRGGNDTIDGKGGVDRASYQTSPAGVTASLAAGSAIDGWGGMDALLNIENIRGSDLADSLTGDAGANDLEGRAGNDTLIGGDGQDSLRGGAGNDTLDGGAQRSVSGSSVRDNWAVSANQGSQYDIALYTDATSAVTVMLGADGTAGSATGGGIGTDVLINIEYVIGSAYNDLIHGSDRALSEIFRGAGGNDTIQGGSGTGTDQGFNYVDYRFGAGAVTVSLATGSATGADGNDVLLGTFSGIFSGDFNDVLTGDAGDNFFDASAGNDTIDGGAGWDALGFGFATGGVSVNMATGTSSGAAGNDVFSGIEAVRGSGFADTLGGSDNADDIQGQAGNDSIDAGAANDTLHGGYGDDSIDGGTGTDTALYAGPRSSYVITWSGAGFTVSGADEGTDTLSNIEQVQFADQTVETIRPDVLGFSPADAATGVAVDATIALTFNEAIARGAGTIVLKNAAGATVASFDAATSPELSITGAALTLNPGADLAHGIRHVLEIPAGAITDLSGNPYAGTTSYDFTTAGVTGGLSGTNVDDRLQGAGGDDIFTPGLGNDTVDGGAGVDTVILPMFPNVFTLAESSPGQVSGSYADYSLSLNDVEFVQFGTYFQTTLAVGKLVSGEAQLQLGRLTDLYLAFFGRAPDTSGLEYWQESLLELGRDFATISKDFAWSDEAQALYPVGGSNREFVRTVYLNCFAREPDAGGWDYWTARLDGLGVTDLNDRGAFVGEVILGAYAPSSGPEDRALLTNRHEAAMYYVNQLSNTPSEGFDPAINALLVRVTGDAATEDKAEDVIDYAFANPVTLTGIMTDPPLLDSIWGA
jgi:Ca2+-binding RTX toxin-like protein